MTLTCLYHLYNDTVMKVNVDFIAKSIRDVKGLLERENKEVVNSVDSEAAARGS